MILLSIGHGFETCDGRKGIVMKLDRHGNIVQSRALWDQRFMDSNVPGIVNGMRPFHVFETDSVSHKVVDPNQLERVFLVNPHCLASPADMDGEGNALVVGVVSDADRRPFTVQGVNASPPFITLGVLRDNARFFEGGICVALKDTISAQIENAFRDIAWARAEDRDRSLSTEIRGVLGKQVIALMHHLNGGCSFGLEVEYKTNCLKLIYQSWCVQALLQLMDRNATKTNIRSMACMFEAGPPAIKWQILPFDKVVVTLAFFKLLNSAGTACESHNEGTPGAHRELHSNLGDRNHCYFCFRRNTPDDPRRSCLCTEASQFRLHEEVEQGALTAEVEQGALNAGIRDEDSLLEPGPNEDEERLNVEAVEAAEARERLCHGGDGGDGGARRRRGGDGGAAAAAAGVAGGSGC